MKQPHPRSRTRVTPLPPLPPPEEAAAAAAATEEAMDTRGRRDGDRSRFQVSCGLVVTLVGALG